MARPSSCSAVPPLYTLFRVHRPPCHCFALATAFKLTLPFHARCHRFATAFACPIQSGRQCVGVAELVLGCAALIIIACLPPPSIPLPPPRQMIPHLQACASSSRSLPMPTPMPAQCLHQCRPHSPPADLATLDSLPSPPPSSPLPHRLHHPRHRLAAALATTSAASFVAPTEPEPAMCFTGRRC